LITFPPQITIRNFVNENDPIPNVDLPALRFLDGIPRIRLFNETIGYYNIRPLKQTRTSSPTTTKELRKISFYNYIDLPLIALLSTDHALANYIAGMKAIDTGQFQFEVTNFYFAQSGEEYTPDRFAILLNVLSRFLPQNYGVP